jgi:hypothetical protein
VRGLPGDRVKAITIRQPWAQAVAAGVKRIENRTTVYTYRGLLAIHAGVAWSHRGAADERIATWHGHRMLIGQPCHPMPHERLFPTSAVIGVCELVDAHPDGGCCRPWGESSYREAGGRERQSIAHLVLQHRGVLAEPIPLPGRLGLWTVPPDVIDRIKRELCL